MLQLRQCLIAVRTPSIEVRLTVADLRQRAFVDRRVRASGMKRASDRTEPGSFSSLMLPRMP